MIHGLIILLIASENAVCEIGISLVSDIVKRSVHYPPYNRNEAEGRGQGRQGKRRDSLLLLEQRQQSSPPLLPADPGRGGGGRGEPSPSTPQSSAAALEQLSSASDRTGSLKRAVVRLKRRSVQELMSEHSTPSSSRRGSDVMTERLN